jgi:hypothetical protein
MRVSLKVGSVITIPVLTGWLGSSTDSAVATAFVNGNSAIVRAMKVGSCKLVLGIDGDLSISLQIDVTA